MTKKSNKEIAPKGEVTNFFRPTEIFYGHNANVDDHDTIQFNGWIIKNQEPVKATLIIGQELDESDDLQMTIEEIVKRERFFLNKPRLKFSKFHGVGIWK